MNQPAAEPQAPDVSVVIPTFNRAAAMERCLSALAAQTHPCFEVIVVDDASTDATVEMLRRFSAAHAGLCLRWLVNDRNAGANVSRNRGTQKARGRFVAYLDSDCVPEPDWLARLIGGFSGEQVAAVTGRVLDPPATNVYELALRGLNRVHGRGRAPRLVGGNMAVRRELMERLAWDEDRRFQAMQREGVPDVSNSGGCDEEGLYHVFRRLGHAQVVVPEARVLHEHGYDRRAFFKQAYYGGGSAAHLVWKYRLWHRGDVAPLLAAWVALPLGLIDSRAWIASDLLAVLWLALIVYNELHRKGKSLGQTILSLPLVMAYYHVRAWAYLRETLRLWTGARRIERVCWKDLERRIGRGRAEA